MSDMNLDIKQQHFFPRCYDGGGKKKTQEEFVKISRKAQKGFWSALCKSLEAWKCSDDLQHILKHLSWRYNFCIQESIHFKCAI